jgi:hypothetical protein
LFGTCVLYVDEGTITVDLSPTELPPVLSTKRNAQVHRTPVAASAHVVVTAGEVMSFPVGSQYTFRHEATDSGVTAFTIALPGFHYIGPHQPQEPTATDGDGSIEESPDLGGVQTALGGEQALDPLSGVTVAFGRVHLPSGANIAFHEADGSLFVVVEAGTRVLTHGHDGLSLDRLDTDGLGLVEPGEPFALHNLGDDAATVFVVTVLPRTTLATPAS